MKTSWNTFEAILEDAYAFDEEGYFDFPCLEDYKDDKDKEGFKEDLEYSMESVISEMESELKKAKKLHKRIQKLK